MTECLECGRIVPYQGRGRPRQRHVRCMTDRQRFDRVYMKAYLPKYYGRGDNRKKQNMKMRKRREKSDETQD